MRTWGDVGDSVTGDKKTQKFEDDYLDQLFDVIKELNFKAVTYMPSRNTMEQLRRVRALCERYGFFQISGEDINSPAPVLYLRGAAESGVCKFFTIPR